MRHRVPGLHQASTSSEIPDGLYLVQVDRVQYRWSRQKPFYAVRFRVIEPKALLGALVEGRLYLTPKALWKLAWFLRDFGYDTELSGCDELDEKALVGLRGVVKISHAVVHGNSIINLHGFAPAAPCEELSSGKAPASEVAR